MNETKKSYCAYGSNMNLKQMKMRCPKAKVIGTGILDNHKLTFRGIQRGVANIESCKGRKVPIVLWEITKECEKELDIYEGFPRLYTKKNIKVVVNEESVEAMVYVMTDGYTNMVAAPTEYYFNTIARGYADNNIGLKPLQIAYSECLEELREE